MATLIKSYSVSDRLLHGLIPALLIHLSIGSVYSWTMLVGRVSLEMNSSPHIIHWAFSLAIFFLGMSAAFGGKLSERNITMSAGLSTFMFITGLVVAGFGVLIKSTTILLLGYGCIMGIGLGIGYITPVKNIMLWYPKSNGIAVGATILGFGLSSSVSSILISELSKDYPADIVLFSLASIYLVPMMLGTILIKRPDGYSDKNPKKIDYNLKEVFSIQFFTIWLIMLLSITAGLAIIGNAQQIMVKSTVFKPHVIVGILFLMGLFNGAGRLLLSSSTDRMKRKSRIYYWIFGLPILALSLYSYIPDMIPKILLISTFMYGAGFSCLPIIIKEKFGLRNLSILHGLALTSWAVAGLIGNQLGDFIIGNYGINELFIILTSMYLLGFILTYKLSRECSLSK